ncbi:MAG: efflux RND transporter periplasmic adaptor subunit [Synechococcales bacterium]|nr:efflux RND transporter periplasmic adaptor subunit [Cyanobacteria bacterium REEB444]MEB3124316.1 efflux RND transporter periplasmic adaptor subunit [Synechococcales bacterium]
MQIAFVGKARYSTPWAIALISVGLLGIGAAAYVSMRGAHGAEDELNRKTTEVSLTNLTVRIVANGIVRPIEIVNLSPKNAGRLAALNVEQGDRVQKGQVIARMESRDLEAQLMQAKAIVAQTQAQFAQLQNGTRPEELIQAQASVRQGEAQVDQSKSRLKLARDRVQRNQLLQSEGAIALDRLDEVLNEQRSAEATLLQTQANLSQIQSRLTQLQNGPRPEEITKAAAQVREAEGRVRAIMIQLEDTIIRAPFDGIITQRYADPGAFVTPTTSASANASATSTSVVALANGLEILAKVPEVDIGQIKLKQTVEIVADSFPDQVFEGRVRLIAPVAVVDQNVTSFEVRVDLSTGLDRLRSGMNVDASFVGQQINNALVIPTVAIVSEKGETGVYLPGSDDKQKTEFKPVTLGTTIGDQTQVIRGLTVGERVYIDLPKDKKSRLR